MQLGHAIPFTEHVLDASLQDTGMGFVKTCCGGTRNVFPGYSQRGAFPLFIRARENLVGKAEIGGLVCRVALVRAIQHEKQFLALAPDADHMYFQDMP